MQDRTIKILLTAIMLLLCGLLLRPLLQPTAGNAQNVPLPTQAQNVPASAAAQTLVVKDDYSLYVMRNGKVYVYTRMDDGSLRWVLWQTLDPANDVAQRGR